jgi:hypothetical protein
VLVAESLNSRAIHRFPFQSASLSVPEEEDTEPIQLDIERLAAGRFA